MGEEQILTLTISLGGLVFIIIVALIKGFLLSKRKFICSHCGKEFYPKWYQVMFETHFNDYFRIRCPHCNKKKYQKIIDYLEKMWYYYISMLQKSQNTEDLWIIKTLCSEALSAATTKAM